MKRLFPVASLVFLSLLLLTQIGCDSDEDTTGVDGPCGITVTRPLPGEVFLSNEEVKIYWRRSGSVPSVKIDLLKAGAVVGEITTFEENDGYYFWDANNMEQANGLDFSVRVSAMGEPNCFDESPTFALTNVIGCNFDFFTPPPNPAIPRDDYVPLTLTADGSTYEITWFSSFTSGLVDIHLVHVSDVVGVIATDVVDSLQSYTWNIDSLHQGSGSNYKIQISDTKVISCKKISPYFDLVDENICNVTVGTPLGGETLVIGTLYDISWTFLEVDGSLDIFLYYNGRRIQTIAENVDPDQSVYRWTVYVPSLPADNKMLYQIRIVDNNNLYAPCEGQTGAFLITN